MFKGGMFPRLPVSAKAALTVRGSISAVFECETIAARDLQNCVHGNFAAVSSVTKNR